MSGPSAAAPPANGSATATATATPAPGDAAPAASTRPPDPTEGDRTALIDQDVARHPPQTAIASRDPSHLQTEKMKLNRLLDRSVRSQENNEVGRVIDVMTGDDGKPAALELDVGGFMGVGNRRIAVAWSLFDLSRTGQNDPLRVALSAAQVRSAPAMDDSGDIQVVIGATPVSASPQADPAVPVQPAVPPGPVLATPPVKPPVVPPTAPPVIPSVAPPVVPPTPPSGSTPVSPVGKAAASAPTTPSTTPPPLAGRVAPSRSAPVPHRVDRTTTMPGGQAGEDRF